MTKYPPIAVLGTYDSKAEEHFFLKTRIEERGFRSLTVNVGTKGPSPLPADIDLYAEMCRDGSIKTGDRDHAIQSMLERARKLVRELCDRGDISGIISAGGGTGTHLCTGVMRALPLGIPKIMVSTVASRNMAQIVGTKDITMMHSVTDILGVNSISGSILDKAAGAICGMVQSHWKAPQEKKRIALTFFGFITKAAENIRRCLEQAGYEVIPFHANGTGGTAMTELAAEGCFHGILDLATHELADAMMKGYCGGIGPERFEPIPGKKLPRLIVPGGLDCAVLEFTRDNIPPEFRDRKIFFYDFRSAIRFNEKESAILAKDLAEKLNHDESNVKVLIPLRGWSEADCEGGPLYDPPVSKAFTDHFRENLSPRIEITAADHHINDLSFARTASRLMDEMLQRQHCSMTGSFSKEQGDVM